MSWMDSVTKNEVFKRILERRLVMKKFSKKRWVDKRYNAIGKIVKIEFHRGAWKRKITEEVYVLQIHLANNKIQSMRLVCANKEEYRLSLPKKLFVHRN